MSDLVTAENGPRPAGPPDQCFYCGRRLGLVHKDDCVLLEKKVMIRVTIEYPVNVPRCWTKENVEFQRNLGSWCADNVIGELERLIKDDDSLCLCQCAHFEYLSDVS